MNVLHIVGRVWASKDHKDVSVLFLSSDNFLPLIYFPATVFSFILLATVGCCAWSEYEWSAGPCTITRCGKQCENYSSCSISLSTRRWSDCEQNVTSVKKCTMSRIVCIGMQKGTIVFFYAGQNKVRCWLGQMTDGIKVLYSSPKEWKYFA